MEWGEGDGRRKQGKQEEKERWKRRSGSTGERPGLGNARRWEEAVEDSRRCSLPYAGRFLFFSAGTVSQVLSWALLAAL